MSTLYSAMTYELSAHLPGCPQKVMENSVKKIIRDLCARAHVWRDFGAPITLAVGDYDYVPTAVQTYAEVIGVLSAKLLVSGNTTNLRFIPFDQVQRQYPAWPENMEGTPVVLTAPVAGALHLVPVPDAVGTLTPYVILTPTLASTQWDTPMYGLHERVIFHGVLHDLMMMRDRSWANEKLAMYHGKQWTYLLAAARTAADQSYNPASLHTQQRPLA